MNQTPVAGYDWLATGGAYWIIGAAWLLSAASFAIAGMLRAKATGNENDGCLLAICSVVLAFTGGGIGLYGGLTWSGYPTFILTSLIGTILLPGVVTGVLMARMKRHH